MRSMHDRIVSSRRRCSCCGTPWGATGCVIGPECACTPEWCGYCFRCLRCCPGHPRGISIQLNVQEVEDLVAEISAVRQVSIMDWKKPALDRLTNALILELARLKGERPEGVER